MNFWGYFHFSKLWGNKDLHHQTAKEICLWQQRVERGPPSPAYEQSKRRHLVDSITNMWAKRLCWGLGRTKSNFPRVQPRTGPLSAASHLPVRSAVASHRRHMSMMDALGRRGFFSLSVVFSRVAASTSPLPSDLSSSYLPSTAPSLATASFSSTSHLLAAQTSPSVSMLDLIGNITEVSGQNQNYIWKAERSLSCVHDASGWQLLPEDFNRSLFFSFIRGLKSEKCWLAVLLITVQLITICIFNLIWIHGGS